MAKSKFAMGVQQNLISPNKELKAVLEYLCSEANKLANCATYYARQMFFKAKKYVTGFDLVKEIGSNRHFSALPSDVAVQSCLSVGESVASFSGLLKKFWKGELENKPKFPNYRKHGYQLVSFPKRSLKLIDNQIRFPLGLQVKAWFGLKDFYLPMPSNREFEALREVRILPRNGCFYAEFVYKVEAVLSDVNPDFVLGIDPGLNNWLTCVSNVGTSFIIDGKHLKSLNQFYNKQVSTIKEKKPQGFWSNKLAAITEKRNRQMRDAVNKAARKVINHCLKYKIGTLVFGWNKGQKNSSNMGRVNNQKFVSVPTARLKDRISQLCEQYGIAFVETEESYTSKASFLDLDTLPTFGAKPEGWQPSGKRVKRGLYRSSNGTKINADCNGAGNIIRKVAATLGINLDGVSSGALLTPLRVQIWAT